MLVDTSASMWFQKTWAAMLSIKRLAAVTPQVNLRNSTQERKCTSDIHPGFENQGRYYQKSKTGVSVAPQNVFQKV